MTDAVAPPPGYTLVTPTATAAPSTGVVVPEGYTLTPESEKKATKVVDPVLDVVQSIPTGLAKFATGLAALPRVIKDFSFPDNPYSNSPNPVGILNKWPSPEELWKGSGASEAFHEPQTEAGKWASAGAEGALSLLSGRPSSTILGTLSGLGGEAASRLFGDQPWARSAGQMLTLLLGGPKAVVAPGSARVVKEVLHTTPAATLDAAQAAARDAGAAVGTQVSPVNFLPANNPLVALRGAVASDVRGGATQAQINAEKAASQAAGAAEIEKLAPGVTPSAETGAAVDASLAEVPKLADQASNAAASDLYDAAAKQTLTEPDVENIVQSLQGAQHRANAATDVDHPMFPQFEREKSAFNKYLPQQAPESVLDALEPAPPLPPAAPFPSWNTINAMGKAKLDQGKSVLIGAKATPAQVVKADVGGILKDAAAAESMPIAGANIIGTTGRDFLSPAGIEEGAKNLSNAAVTPENVRDISSSMARADAKLGVTEPTFPLMAKEKQLVESAKAPDMGKWSRDTSGSATGSSGQQAVRANFLETEKQAFIQGGATEADAARAAEGAAKVHDVIQAIADGHTNLPTNVSIARVLADASSGVLSKVLRFMTPSFEMVRTWTAANHLDKVSFAKTMANLDKALASPDMVADLKKFAEWNWQAKLAKAGARAGVSVGARYENN